MTIDDKTRIELEAAVFRRVVSHLRSRTDVQNIETMDLTGFCRNCLASWMLSEAEAVGLTVTRDEGLRAAQTPRNSIEMVFVHSSCLRASVGHDRARRTMRTGPVHAHPASPSTAARGQVRSIRV